jgi:hypothetical protein
MIPVIHSRVDTLINCLQKKYPNDPRTKKLFTRDFVIRPKRIIPFFTDSKTVAFTVNKDTIEICVKGPKDGSINGLDESLVVILHELAHVITPSFGHTKEFWDNLKFLEENAFTCDEFFQSNEIRKGSKFSFCGEQFHA